MKKIIIFSCLLASVLPVFAQQSSLLEKYRVMALEYNHDLKAAEKSISMSLELEKSARADLKPKLGAGGNFQYTGNPMKLSLDVPPVGRSLSFEGKDMQYGLSMSLSQPLYTGGRVLESIRIAQSQQTVASLQAEIVKTAVCYQTDIQYWNTVARQEVVGVATEFCTSMTALVKTIRERVEAGLVDPQDLLMAEVKLNEAEYRLLQAKSDFETGRMALNSIVGL